METAKAFSNSESKMIHHPKTCYFTDDEILVNRIGDSTVLCPKNDRWSDLLTSIDMFTDDFLAEPVESLPPDERQPLV